MQRRDLICLLVPWRYHYSMALTVDSDHCLAQDLDEPDLVQLKLLFQPFFRDLVVVPQNLL